MELIFFYIFAGVTVAGAVAVIAMRNMLSSAIALVVSLFGMACVFALLNAHFLAVMQVLVYAGAVMVLFVFVIMLMNLGQASLQKLKTSFTSVAGFLVGACLLALFTIKLLAFTASPAAENVPQGNLHDIGRLLFSEYLVPFELVSFLLLVAVLGAVVLSREEQA